MRRRLHHPLWTHMPAFLLWAGFIGWFLITASQLSDAVPLQISWSGEPRTWGSPWVTLALVGGLGLFFVALSILIDELWASQETKKRFNFLSLLDEVVLGLLVTIQITFLHLAKDGAAVYRVPLEWFLLGLGGALASGIVLEWLRSFRGSPFAPQCAEVGEGFQSQLSASVARGEFVTYWDVQNPRYVTWLSIGIPVVLWISAGVLASTSLLGASILALVGLVLMQFYGGQRTRVDSGGVSIRYGLAGLRVFRCELAEIAAIRIRSFAPLADFGGYGIRVAGGVTAYYLAGRTGVQLQLRERRDVLIGSPHPERLAAVLEVLGGLRSQEEVET